MSSPQLTLKLPPHPDCHLREEFLCLSQKRLHAAHAEHCQVRLSPPPPYLTPVISHPQVCCAQKGLELGLISATSILKCEQLSFCIYHSKLCSQFYPSPGRPLIPNLSNTLYRVVVLDKVTDLLLFFGKLLVVGGVGKDQDRELQEQRTRVLDSLRGDLEE